MTAIPAISLLVCTRNRADALPRLLASITHAAAQEGAPAIEVVIVDNGSTDATADRLAAWQVQQSFPVRLLHSDRPGLARARNAGLAAVRGAIIAMTDDDCRLHADYFIALARCFAALDGSAIVGGRMYASGFRPPQDGQVQLLLHREETELNVGGILTERTDCEDSFEIIFDFTRALTLPPPAPVLYDLDLELVLFKVRPESELRFDNVRVELDLQRAPQTLPPTILEEAGLTYSDKSEERHLTITVE